MEEPQPKTTFTDTEGRTWNMHLNVQRAMDLRDKLAIDVEKFADPSTGLLEKMIDDSWLLIDVLRLMTADERAAKGIDDNSFLKAIDGTVLDEALMAFLNGIAVSLKKLKRRALLAMARQMEQGMEIAATKVEARIAKNFATVEQQIDSSIGQ